MTKILFYDLTEQKSIFESFSPVVPRIGEEVAITLPNTGRTCFYSVLDVKYNYSFGNDPREIELFSVQVNVRDKVYDSYIGG